MRISTNTDISAATPTEQPLQNKLHKILIATAKIPYKGEKYNHEGDGFEKLIFRTGENIIVEEEKEGWIYGTIGENRKGWFPKGNVEIEEHYV